MSELVRWTFDARWDDRNVHERDYMVRDPEGEWVRYHDIVGQSRGARDVLAERQRQIEIEGWTAEHDDREHVWGQLAWAGACYATAQNRAEAMPPEWPWATKWWKPKDRRRNLIRAAALIIAEIDRLDRVAGSPAGGKPDGA